MGTRRVTDLIPRERRHRLTIEDFHGMGEAGILGEDARVELIEGELVDMPPVGSEHAGEVRILIHILSRAVGDLAIVDAPNPVVLSEDSEPQPDIMLLKPRKDFYTRSHPGPGEVLLLMKWRTRRPTTTARSKSLCTRSTASQKYGFSICRRNGSKSIVRHDLSMPAIRP